ncbi:MAG: GNAT family N-acetyltransferase, partial [Phototrophicaceae bacterium]
MISIRPATANDIDAIVRVHIDSWIAQFTPFLSAQQVLLKELDEGKQIKLWQARFATEEGISRKTFVAEQHNQVIAYITGRDSDGIADAELHQIYVQTNKHRLGIGRRLVAELAKNYHHQGKKSLFVWVMT